jgi:hypothetical protein
MKLLFGGTPKSFWFSGSTQTNICFLCSGALLVRKGWNLYIRLKKHFLILCMPLNGITDNASSISVDVIRLTQSYQSKILFFGDV